MSNYYFDVDFKLQVGIPLDQICDDDGGIVDGTYSKDDIIKALLEEIDYAAKDRITDGHYKLIVDPEEVENAADLFFK